MLQLVFGPLAKLPHAHAEISSHGALAAHAARPHTHRPSPRCRHNHDHAGSHAHDRSHRTSSHAHEAPHSHSGHNREHSSPSRGDETSGIAVQAIDESPFHHDENVVYLTATDARLGTLSPRSTIPDPIGWSCAILSSTWHGMMHGKRAHQRLWRPPDPVSDRSQDYLLLRVLRI